MQLMFPKRLGLRPFDFGFYPRDDDDRNDARRRTTRWTLPILLLSINVVVILVFAFYWQFRFSLLHHPNSIIRKESSRNSIDDDTKLNTSSTMMNQHECVTENTSHECVTENTSHEIQSLTRVLNAWKFPNGPLYRNQHGTEEQISPIMMQLSRKQDVESFKQPSSTSHLSNQDNSAQISYKYETNPQNGPLPINMYEEFRLQLERKNGWNSMTSGRWKLTPKQYEENKKWSPRIREFIADYRAHWGLNTLTEFTDHVYYEPNWNIVAKCPSNNKDYETYLPKNPLTGKQKQLGVYIVMTDFSKNKVHREGEFDRGIRIDLYGAIINWKENVFKHFPHPFIIFHYGKLLEPVKQFVEKELTTLNMQVTFVEISTHTFLKRKADGKQWKNSDVNYRHFWGMNKFYIHDLFAHPSLKDFEYYMRFDDDFRLMEPLKYDIFKFMEENNLQVGYSCLGMPDHASGFWSGHLHERIWSYFLRQGILPLEEMRTAGKWGQADTIHAGPFEVARISVYDNPNYYHFIESVDIWEGTGVYRWSEQNFKSQWIKMYVPRLATHWFCDLSTYHKVFFVPRCNLTCI
ncbi:hypothetical protein FDP41_007345 [Naegleria fowleri]|uniref:Uncharacterized protein n=1 Tax=Naegleria fowleri TaxID=5763 RepID=A0A6A5CFP1_NAEFO|nr:uncharacterized protein FDP41_007345 [Naegleria fowleri]KAF0984168.1 hypothetical protein FDP41_007345 [Naegleria fowleri]